MKLIGLAPRRPRSSSAKLAALLLAAASSLALAGSAAASTTINFGSAQTIAADTDVLNTGTTFLANAFNNNPLTTTVTVNGVTFTASDNTAPGNLTITGLTTSFVGAGSSHAPFSNLSANYQSLLSAAFFGGGNGSLTIKGLTSGDQYEAQFFVNDSRTAGVGRAETLTGGAALSFNSTGQDGGVGQFADSSIFTADASGMATFAVTPNAQQVGQVNAFQVRDLGPSPVPEASTTVSLGVMLGLGGLALVAGRRRMATGK